MSFTYFRMIGAKCLTHLPKQSFNHVHFLLCPTHFHMDTVATPLWDKREDETHTPKSEKLESSEILKNLKLEFKGQNTSH